MKINIGPYKNWVGPYQIADLLTHVGVSTDRCHKIGKWLANTWVNTACEWIDGKKKRTVKIHIDKYDTWSMDNTLALIIVPMLKQLKEKKHGSPLVDDVDVPEHLRSTSAPPKQHEWDTDDFVHDRWDYVMDRMIWSFEQCSSDNDSMALFFGEGRNDADGYKMHQQKVNEGLMLFGKYYQGLWD